MGVLRPLDHHPKPPSRLKAFYNDSLSNIFTINWKRHQQQQQQPHHSNNTNDDDNKNENNNQHDSNKKSKFVEFERAGIILWLVPSPGGDSNPFPK